ncbi:MAG: DUF4423 domain-containing protein [Bdellovibrionaceae bacterium]|nr:DUF4423 domain-containing protein [Pseudobdellovibrionaceae bacterium]
MAQTTPVFYAHTCYKAALKETVKDLKKKRPTLTLAKIAERLPVQATFLSKALNDEKAHLNEDHLFKMGQMLELLPEEIDYLFLLRSQAVATSPERREFLQKRIEKTRKEKILSVDSENQSNARLAEEMSYLLNPYCMLVHVALFIEAYEKNPRKLMTPLGLTEAKLKEYLLTLEKNEFLVLGKDPFQIKEVKTRYPHYGPDHPLMRLHQQVVKTHLIQRLGSTNEADKESFFVTFTGDDDTFQKVKKRFREFMQDVQKLSFDGDSRHVFQMSFDFAKYF